MLGHGAGLTERERVTRPSADALRPLQPDPGSVEDPLVVVDRLRHVPRELARLGVEALGKVIREPADLEVAAVHADAGDHLEQVEHQVPLAEGVPEHRDRAELGADVPSQTRCEWMRLSSERHIRIQVAFSGVSRPSSFSIAITKTSSFAWNAT